MTSRYRGPLRPAPLTSRDILEGLLLGLAVALTVLTLGRWP